MLIDLNNSLIICLGGLGSVRGPETGEFSIRYPSLAFTEISCSSGAAASELDALRQSGLLSWRAALAGGAARPLGRLARLALLGR